MITTDIRDIKSHLLGVNQVKQDFKSKFQQIGNFKIEYRMKILE